MAKQKSFSGCGTVMILSLLGLLVYIVNTSVNSANRPREVQPPPTVATETIIFGDHVTVDDGDSICCLGIDDEAFDELLDVQNRHESVQPLIDADRVITARKGTKAKVIKTAVFSCRVRLEEGHNEGKSGWIQRGFIRKQP